jgi:hypothetical protein
MVCSPGSGGTWRIKATPKALWLVAVLRWIPGCKVATYTLIRGLSPLRTGTNIRQRLITGWIHIFVFKIKRSRIIALKFTPATGYERLDPSPNVKAHYHLPTRCCTFPPVHELRMFVVLCETNRMPIHRLLPWWRFLFIGLSLRSCSPRYLL